ncbi:MAG: 3-deoxy-manno-octulosonate cytidylyltransferase [Planctomycetes bacterium]|nr:3-deoxy-manno-octulosonate cytidylyltransferase [Planctomycetota bacterium]
MRHTECRTLVVIPARYGSTRLPAKVLLKTSGKYLMQHTYEQTLKCKLVDRIIIATDDKRVFKAGKEFKAEARMTSRYHTCGTERIAQVARHLPYQYVINVQADEPQIDPKAVDKVIAILQRNKDVDIATLAARLDKKDMPDMNKVKVRVAQNNLAVGFMRVIHHSPLATRHSPLYRHIGIYGYKKDALLRFVKLPQTKSEKELRLEQLRALENGFKIKVALIDKAFYGIDTPRDYQAFLKRIKNTD